MEPLIVYFSSSSVNTHRFIERLGMRAKRIPTSAKVEMLVMGEPYILVCPTYAGDDGSGAVPKQVIKFLNDVNNRSMIRGVIASGNRNFGKYYAYAGPVISNKCNVPCLYKFELSGTEQDIINVRQGVNKLWKSLTQQYQPIEKTGT